MDETVLDSANMSAGENIIEKCYNTQKLTNRLCQLFTTSNENLVNEIVPDQFDVYKMLSD